MSQNFAYNNLCISSVNSSYNVGISQQRRIQEELSRAAFLTRHEVNWRSLYSRNNFFDRHANFLQITIRSQNPDEFTKWLRLCESRLRILVCALDSPEMSAWPYAQIMKRFYTPVIDDNSAAKSDEKNNNLQSVTKTNKQQQHVEIVPSQR